MYCKASIYKTVKYSDTPISTCLLDQMKNDANFSEKNPRIGDEGKHLTEINQVFETFKSFELSLNAYSTVQNLNHFLEEASNILQRTISIVNIKGGEQVFECKAAQNVQAEPYHLCFVQDYNHKVYSRCWLSINCKNVKNTPAGQKELAIEEDKPDLKKTHSFSRVLNFFRK